MKCTYCGYELKRTQLNCPACGTQQYTLPDDKKRKSDSADSRRTYTSAPPAVQPAAEITDYTANSGGKNTAPGTGNTSRTYSGKQQPKTKHYTVKVPEVTGKVHKFTMRFHWAMMIFAGFTIILALFLNAIEWSKGGGFYRNMYYYFLMPEGSEDFSDKHAFMMYKAFMSVYNKEPQRLVTDNINGKIIGWVFYTGEQQTTFPGNGTDTLSSQHLRTHLNSGAGVTNTSALPEVLLVLMRVSGDTVAYTYRSFAGSIDGIELMINFDDNGIIQPLLRYNWSEAPPDADSLQLAAARQFSADLTFTSFVAGKITNRGNALNADSLLFGNKQLFADYLAFMQPSGYRRDTLIPSPSASVVAAVITKVNPDYDVRSLILLGRGNDSLHLFEYSITTNPEVIKWVTLKDTLYLFYVEKNSLGDISTVKYSVIHPVTGILYEYLFERNAAENPDFILTQQPEHDSVPREVSLYIKARIAENKELKTMPQQKAGNT